MGANCCKRGEPFIPGEVLDRVIAEKSADDKCQLYDLANFRKSGILIEAFNNGGSKGVSSLDENSRQCIVVIKLICTISSNSKFVVIYSLKQL